MFEEERWHGRYVQRPVLDRPGLQHRHICLFAQTGTPGVCAKSCQAATDCPDGLGCWISLGGTTAACFPVDSVSEGGKALVLNCDPTVAGCTFTGSALPGGCDRQILGAGSAGVCREGCDIGVDTCPKGADGSPQACYYADNTLDSTGMPTGDVLKQPICQFFDPQVAAGAECLDPTTMNHYFNIRPAGQQCESAFTTASVTPRQPVPHSCYIGNFTCPTPVPSLAMAAWQDPARTVRPAPTSSAPPARLRPECRSVPVSGPSLDVNPNGSGRKLGPVFFW